MKVYDAVEPAFPTSWETVSNWGDRTLGWSNGERRSMIRRRFHLRTRAGRPIGTNALEALEPRLPLAADWGISSLSAEPENDANPVVEQVLIGEVPTTTLEVVFSKSMQLSSKIEDGSILDAVHLTHYRTGPVTFSTRNLSVGQDAQSLIWSSAAALAPGFYQLQLDGASLLDTEGNALLGGAGGLGFQIPTFSGEVLIESEGAAIAVDAYSVPTQADWNSDGIQDLVVGEQDDSGGKVRVYVNVGTNQSPQYDGFFYVQYQGADLTVPCTGCLGVYPRIFDWNQDGRQDLLLGLADGRIQVYPNTQSGAEPVFGVPHYLQVGPSNAKIDLSVGYRATFQVVDWNNDGQHDLIAGGLNGKVGVYLNSSPGGEPDFQSVSLVQDSAGDLIVPTGRSSIAVADLDGDGRKDLVLGNTEGQVLYYANIGTDTVPEFDTWQAIQADGIEINLEGIPRSRPEVVDYDADGLPDLLVGSADGLVRWYRASAWMTPFPEDTVLDAPGTPYQTVFQVAAAPWQNPIEPTDATGDGRVVPLDALTIINELNSPEYSDAEGQLPASTPDAPPPFFDVNGDGYCTPIDALLVINRLNTATAGTTAVAVQDSNSAAAMKASSEIASAIDFLFADEESRLDFLSGDDSTST